MDAQEKAEKMDSVFTRLSDSSLTLRDALRDSASGFKEQGDAIREVNEYLLVLETRMNNMKRTEAHESFKDTGDLRSAQEALQIAEARLELWEAYQEFLNDATWTGDKDPFNFELFASLKNRDAGFEADIKEMERWMRVLNTYSALLSEGAGIFTIPPVEPKFHELEANAVGVAQNAADALDEVWNEIAAHLEVFAKSPLYGQMSEVFQQQMDNFFDEIVGGIDRTKEITKDDLMGLSAELSTIQTELYNLSQNHPELSE